MGLWVGLDGEQMIPRVSELMELMEQPGDGRADSHQLETTFAGSLSPHQRDHLVCSGLLVLHSSHLTRADSSSSSLLLLSARYRGVPVHPGDPQRGLTSLWILSAFLFFCVHVTAARTNYSIQTLSLLANAGAHHFLFFYRRASDRSLFTRQTQVKPNLQHIN